MNKRLMARQETAERLLEAARIRISGNGLTGLRARDVTADAGCALGMLYKCYSDLDTLIDRVNMGTLVMLLSNLRQAVAGTTDPVDQLKVLAKTYLAFAVEHRNLWSSVFEHRQKDQRPIPQDYVDANQRLLGVIGEAMGKLKPDIVGDELDARVRTYFGAVHGVVTLGLQERFVSVPTHRLEQELDVLVDQLTR
ncbi:MAG: TetR-like C-terminal domain-containing protein [Pseudomonadota bacterium]